MRPLRDLWRFILCGPERLEMLWDRVTKLEAENSALRSTITALTSEVNMLRNAGRATPPAPQPEKVRRAATWREFASAAESRPIEISRSS